MRDCEKNSLIVEISSLRGSGTGRKGCFSFEKYSILIDFDMILRGFSGGKTGIFTPISTRFDFVQAKYPLIN